MDERSVRLLSAGLGIGTMLFATASLIAPRRFARFFGDSLRVECPVGSGRRLTLGEVADELSRRLVSLFVLDGQGRRPCLGAHQGDAAWRDRVLFHEYFDGDTGAGLGASHQTGWTALVLDLLLRS